MNLAPVVIFVYNRPFETNKVLNLLKQNILADQSDLYIFSDGPKNGTQIKPVEDVRKIISNISGFKSVSVIEAKENKGLGNSVISGVSDVIEKHGKVIVLEDDLETSKYFLTYMNQALEYYEDNNSVWSISGYTPAIKFPKYYKEDIYAVKRACSWGWGTWKNRWKKNNWEIKNIDYLIKDRKNRKSFELSGNDMTYMLIDQQKGAIDSWAIRWCYNQYLDNSITIYPRKSFVNNIGFSGEGTHGSISKKFNTVLAKSNNVEFKEVTQRNEIVRAFSEFYNMTTINYIGRLLKHLKLYKQIKMIYKKVRK